MMDFRVGGTPEIGSPADSAASPRGQFEARVLAVRPARSASAPPRTAERRRSSRGRDPRGGRVLVLMVPDGSRLPHDLEKGSYRVLVRFQKQPGG